MAKYNVTNESKRVVTRLNYRFQPKETATVELDDSELLAVRAARALKVEKASDDAELTEGKLVGTSAQFIRESTVDEVMEAVKNGGLEASEALQLEKDGANRSTLIEQLEKVAWGVQKAEDEGDYSLESPQEVTDVEGALMKAESDGSPVAVPSAEALQGNGEDEKKTVTSSEVSSMTVKEVIQAVDNGYLSVDDALTYEKEGKNRESLVSKLEEKKNQ